MDLFLVIEPSSKNYFPFRIEVLSNFVIVQIHYTYFIRRAAVNVDSIVLSKARAKCDVFTQIGLPSTVYVFRVSHRIYFQIERTLPRQCLFLKTMERWKNFMKFHKPIHFFGEIACN